MSESCRFFLRHGRAAEFQDEVSQCLDCGGPLVSGQASEPDDDRPLVRPPVAIPGPTAIAVSYDTMADAYIGRGKLESEGIRARIVDEHIGSMAFVYAWAVGRVKLEVAVQDLSRAREVLAEDRSADLEAVGLATETAERCPRCGSSSVRAPRVGSWGDALLSILSGYFLGLPVAPSSRWRRCENCGFRWRSRPGGGSESSP